MAYLVLTIFLVVVVALTVASVRTGRTTRGCCAPADPAHDLRMRDPLDETGPT